MDPDRVPASSPEKLQAQTKICIQTASFEIQRNFQLNKDSQTDFFSQPKVVVSAVSNPKEPKTSTNIVSSVPSEKS